LKLIHDLAALSASRPKGKLGSTSKIITGIGNRPPVSFGILPENAYPALA